MIYNKKPNGKLLLPPAKMKPKRLPKALQGQRAGQMYTSTRKRQRVEVIIEKSCRSVMSVKEKVEFVKKHGKDAFLELPL